MFVTILGRVIGLEIVCALRGDTDVQNKEARHAGSPQFAPGRPSGQQVRWQVLYPASAGALQQMASWRLDQRNGWTAGWLDGWLGWLISQVSTPQ